jgi:cell division protein FtsZ
MVQFNKQYERHEQPPARIKIVGVGGAGTNILDRVMLDGIEEADLVAINTDVQSLTASVATEKVQLGRNLTRGLGSGGDPELGQATAEEALDDIRSAVSDADVIFVCVGLGGGTGSGAAPVVARLAKEEKALVLVFAALPFGFEGRRRWAQAQEGLHRLRASADAVICFENDRMAEITLPRMGIHEAFAAADLTISQSIRAVARILRHPGILHLGFDDVRAVVRSSDARGLFGFGEAEGENRAHEALARALKNPLMNRGEFLENAHRAIVHICGGSNVTLGEVQIIMEELNRHINDRTHLFMGIAVDPRLGNRLSVSVLSALGTSDARPSEHPKYSPSHYSDELLPAPASPTNHQQPVLEGASDESRTSAGVALFPSSPSQNGDPVMSGVPGEVGSTSPSDAHGISRPEKAVRATSSLKKVVEVTDLEPEKRDSVPAARKDSAPPKPAPAPPAAPAKPHQAKQEVLQFEPVSRGRFEKSEPTIVDGQDLDVPTFLRKQVKVR